MVTRARHIVKLYVYCLSCLWFPWNSTLTEAMEASVHVLSKPNNNATLNRWRINRYGVITGPISKSNYDEDDNTNLIISFFFFFCSKAVTCVFGCNETVQISPLTKGTWHMLKFRLPYWRNCVMTNDALQQLEWHWNFFKVNMRETRRKQLSTVLSPRNNDFHKSPHSCFLTITIHIYTAPRCALLCVRAVQQTFWVWQFEVSARYMRHTV